jgi:hypothetical protein
MGEQDMLTYNIIGVNCEKVQEVIEEALEKEFGESTTKV